MEKKQKTTLINYGQNRGFTLIELLVVIAIIALLMSITLPALRLAKEKTAVVICSSNMKQVVYGLVTYTNDNDGKLPPSSSQASLDPSNTADFHRPFELNWYGNGWVGSGNFSVDPREKNYHYTSKYLGGYLPEAGVFNCPVATIKEDSPWPPETSGFPAEGTYDEFYQNGTFAPLHSTYALLWSYQGYNHKVSDAVIKTKKHFEGPSRMSSSNKLVIQDAITYVKGTNMLFYPPGETPENRFYSSHRFRDAEKARPYFISPQGATERPDCKLNAGYLDGSVDRFDSMDGVEVKNWGAVNYLSPRFR